MANWNNQTAVGGIRFEFISEGWREILNSANMKVVVDEYGELIADKAGEGFNYHPTTLRYGGGRVGGFVSADTRAAREAQATDKALTRAVNT